MVISPCCSIVNVLAIPWESSNDRGSRTTEVQRKLRSLEAVSNCFPSSP